MSVDLKIPKKSSRLAKLNRLLPLVAIGTVADCQSIIEPTNRLLVKAGLQILQSSSHKIAGLAELMQEAGLSKKIQAGYQLTSQDLGFVLSPILNSSGRISHARLSIATLLQHPQFFNPNQLVIENIEHFQESGIDLAKFLIETNNARKAMVKDILGEVETEAQNQVQAGNKTIWLEGDWNKGIIGLLASRLVNQYNLPVIVVSKASE
jgi:single-stranded-DNA-specific exonuclease